MAFKIEKTSALQALMLIGILVLCLMIILYLTNVLGGEKSFFAYLFPGLKERFSGGEPMRIIFYSMNSCPTARSSNPSGKS